MRVYQGVHEFQKLDYPVVTSGTFDGVHLGHQKIIENLKKIAGERGGETVLITYWPHPRHVLYPDDESLKILTTFEEKSELLAAAGVDHLIKIPFTLDFSKLSSSQFIRKILIEQINTKVLVIGYDHRFGRNREGGFKHLKENSREYGFEVQEIPRQDIENMAVSSTKIRKALVEGEIGRATCYLGRHYAIRGTVVHGNRIGREIGFPTANIEVNDKHKLIPADGIYAVRVKRRESIYDGMLSIGYRPTIGDSDRTIEVNIFDFNDDLYGEQLEVYFVARFRDEKKFDTLEELKHQLYLDWQEAVKILSGKI